MLSIYINQRGLFNRRIAFIVITLGLQIDHLYGVPPNRATSPPVATITPRASNNPGRRSGTTSRYAQNPGRRSDSISHAYDVTYHPKAQKFTVGEPKQMGPYSQEQFLGKWLPKDQHQHIPGLIYPTGVEGYVSDKAAETRRGAYYRWGFSARNENDYDTKLVPSDIKNYINMQNVDAKKLLQSKPSLEQQQQLHSSGLKRVESSLMGIEKFTPEEINLVVETAKKMDYPTHNIVLKYEPEPNKLAAQIVNEGDLTIIASSSRLNAGGIAHELTHLFKGHIPYKESPEHNKIINFFPSKDSLTLSDKDWAPLLYELVLHSPQKFSRMYPMGVEKLKYGLGDRINIIRAMENEADVGSSITKNIDHEAFAKYLEGTGEFTNNTTGKEITKDNKRLFSERIEPFRDHPHGDIRAKNIRNIREGIDLQEKLIQEGMPFDVWRKTAKPGAEIFKLPSWKREIAVP